MQAILPLRPLRSTVVSALLALGVLSAGAALVGCSGDDTNPLAPPTDAGTDGSSDASKAADATGSDAPSSTDSAADAPTATDSGATDSGADATSGDAAADASSDDAAADTGPGADASDAGGDAE